MNILLISAENDKYAGSFQNMVALAKLLNASYGHNVLIVLPGEGSGNEQLNEAGIRCVTVRSYMWTTSFYALSIPDTILKDEIKAVITRVSALRLARIIKENGIGFTYINTSASYIGAFATLLAKPSLIWHIREFLEEDQARTIRHRSRGYALMARADRLVAISQSIYDKYEPVFGAGKLVLIQNGIDPARYARPGRTVLGRPRVRFLTVGGGEGKCLYVAIGACLKLLERGIDDFELCMVGRIAPEYRQRLDALIGTEPRAAAHFRFPGPTDDVPAELRRAA